MTRTHSIPDTELASLARWLTDESVPPSLDGLWQRVQVIRRHERLRARFRVLQRQIWAGELLPTAAWVTAPPIQWRAK